MANPPFIVPTRQSYGRAQIAARPHKADGKQMIRSEGEAIQARAGSYYQIGHVGSVKQHRDEQTITAAWGKLQAMMEERKLPPPAANYTLEAIRYNPRFMGLNGDTKSVLAVEQVPSGPDSGTIIAFAPAAETLEHAVRCLAHELFRFHPTKGENHDLCYQYAQAAVRVYNGGSYNGPSVEVEEEPGTELGAEVGTEAEEALPPTTSQAAPTPTPNPRPDREDTDPNQEARRNKDQRIEDRAERNEERLEKEAQEKERQRLIRNLEIQLDNLEALNNEAWEYLDQIELTLQDARPITDIRSGTVGGSFKLMVTLQAQGLNPAKLKADFAAEIERYRQQIRAKDFNPVGVSGKLQLDFDNAMENASSKGSVVSQAIANIQEQHGGSIGEIKDSVAKELYQKGVTKPVTFDTLPPEFQTRVEREVLQRFHDGLADLDLSTKLSGIANGGFVMLTGLIAVDAAKRSPNFYGELSRQVFNIGVTEVAVHILSKVLPGALRAAGINIGTKPLPQAIVMGIVLVGASFVIGNVVDHFTKQSGYFDDLLKEYN